MKYLDKTFWKMFFGFVALILASLVILFSIKVYQEKQNSNQSNLALPAQ